MRKLVLAAAILGALTTTGCKRQVPNDIIQKSLKNALTFHAPATTSGMCGTSVHGLVSPSISVTKKNPDNSGTAHISGSPLGGGAGAPSRCEGDIEFRYTYTTKTTGIRRKTTTTTWYLSNIKLTAVQTKGVTFKAVDEAASDEDDNQ
jgi:hypothetical protein